MFLVEKKKLSSLPRKLMYAKDEIESEVEKAQIFYDMSIIIIDFATF